jgi:hypothetical protein
MQVPHVHVTRMCSRLERRSGDGGILRVMQVLTFNGALHQETSSNEVVDAGLITHIFDPFRHCREFFDRSRRCCFRGDDLVSLIAAAVVAMVVAVIVAIVA